MANTDMLVKMCQNIKRPPSYRFGWGHCNSSFGNSQQRSDFLFFERLEKLCSERETDISNVLNALGLSTSKGTAWRNGSIPKGDVLRKLANYFGVTTDYLLGLIDSPLPPMLNVPPVLNDVLVAFSEKGVDINDLTQGKIEKIAEFAKFVDSQPD